MALQVTWNDGANPPTTFTFSSDIVTSLESYRATFTTTDPKTGLTTQTYATLRDFAVAMFVQRVLAFAVESFPPPSVQKAKDALDVAQQAVAAAKAAAIQQAVV